LNIKNGSIWNPTLCASSTPLLFFFDRFFDFPFDILFLFFDHLFLDFPFDMLFLWFLILRASGCSSRYASSE
jgi:hypothetical protein